MQRFQSVFKTRYLEVTHHDDENATLHSLKKEWLKHTDLLSGKRQHIKTEYGHRKPYTKPHQPNLVENGLKPFFKNLLMPLVLIIALPVLFINMVQTTALVLGMPLLFPLRYLYNKYQNKHSHALKYTAREYRELAAKNVDCLGANALLTVSCVLRPLSAMVFVFSGLIRYAVETRGQSTQAYTPVHQPSGLHSDYAVDDRRHLSGSNAHGNSATPTPRSSTARSRHPNNPVTMVGV